MTENRTRSTVFQLCTLFYIIGITNAAPSLQQLSTELTALNQIVQAIAIAPKVSSGKVNAEEKVKGMFGNNTLETLEKSGLGSLEKELAGMTDVFEKECKNGCGSGKELEEGVKMIGELEKFASIGGEESGLRRIGDFKNLLMIFEQHHDPKDVKQLIDHLDDVPNFPEDDVPQVAVLFAHLGERTKDSLEFFARIQKLMDSLPYVSQANMISELELLSQIQKSYFFNDAKQVSSKFSSFEAAGQGISHKIANLSNIKLSVDTEIQVLESLLLKILKNSTGNGDVSKFDSPLDLTQKRMNLALTDGKDGKLKNIRKVIDPVVQLNKAIEKWAQIRESVKIEKGIRQNVQNMKGKIQKIKDQLANLTSSGPLLSLKDCSPKFKLSPYSEDNLGKAKKELGGLDDALKKIRKVFDQNKFKDPKFDHLIALNSTFPHGKGANYLEALQNLKKEASIPMIRGDLEAMLKILEVLGNNTFSTFSTATVGGVAKSSETWAKSIDISDGLACYKDQNRLQNLEKSAAGIAKITGIKSDDKDVVEVIRTVKQLEKLGNDWKNRKFPAITGSTKPSKFITREPYFVPFIQVLAANFQNLVKLSKVRSEVEKLISDKKSVKLSSRTKSCLRNGYEVMILAEKKWKARGEYKRIHELTEVLSVTQMLENCTVGTIQSIPEMKFVKGSARMRSFLRWADDMFCEISGCKFLTPEIGGPMPAPVSNNSTDDTVYYITISWMVILSLLFRTARNTR